MAARYTGPRLALPGGLAEEIEEAAKRARCLHALRGAAGPSDGAMRSVLDCELVPPTHLSRLAEAMDAAGVPALTLLASEVRALVAGMEVAA